MNNVPAVPTPQPARFVCGGGAAGCPVALPALTDADLVAERDAAQLGLLQAWGACAGGVRVGGVECGDDEAGALAVAQPDACAGSVDEGRTEAG